MSDKLPEIVYLNTCPNCKREISSLKLFKGSACSRCVTDNVQFNSLLELLKYLDTKGRLNELKSYYNELIEAKRVEDLFIKILGSPPIGPQKSWILRAVRGESFVIIAPPGLGKTTFGIIMSLYFTQQNKKTLMLFPTKTLVTQAVGKIQEMSKNLDFMPKLAYYYSGLTTSEKQELNKILSTEDFDIFLTTSRYLIENFEEVSSHNYRYVFVDDIDSVLKSGKSSSTILKLAGFSEDDITMVKELLRKSKEDTTIFDEIKKIREKRLKDRIIVFSSATITKSNPVFSSLMGFRPGSASIYLRNIIDSYIMLDETRNDLIELINKIVSKLGSGGLIFVPIDKGTQYAEELAKNITSIRAEAISSASVRKLEEFEKGEIDALVGVATHYGILVRGIDVPWRIKYAIFVGIPKFRFKIGEAMHPIAMLRMLTLISLVTKDENIIKIYRIVKNYLRRLSPTALALLAKNVKEGNISDKYLQQAYEIVNKYLKNEEILRKISEIGEISINGDYISTPDYLTYIQASGRTSRIYGGELTTGLSILLVDDKKLFELLNRKLLFVLDSINWVPFNINTNKIGDSDLDSILSKINKERQKIEKVKKEGFLASAALSNIKTTLFIVESPNKARTISNFFSKPTIRNYGNLIIYETVIGDRLLMVTASEGHVYDLTTRNIGIHGIEVVRDHDIKFIPYYNTIKRCDKGHQFTEYGENNICPICGSTKIKDKEDILDSLKKLAVEVDEILIGTDPDVEGEKIAWDLYLSLRPFNPNIRRAEFHEVTRKAIMEAINNPRQFSFELLQSQIVRRIEDRWIGFSLSAKLQTDFWKQYCEQIGKEKCEKENRNLSAGRVQTPVLGWVVDRYNKYKNTKRLVYIVKFLNNVSVLIPKQEGINKNSKIKIVLDNITKVSETFGPLPPYTTDTLLYDASELYGISASETMRVAQDLFEMGLITYHRTDSTRISTAGISIAEMYLKQILGDDYKSIFKPRTWGEGGAHEAIRPTKPLDEKQLRTLIEEGDLELPKRLTLNHFRIYSLVFSRFISSQIVPMQLEKLILEIRALSDEKELKIETSEVDLLMNISLPNNIKPENLSLYYPKIYFASRESTYSATINKVLECIDKGKKCEFEGIISGSFTKSDYSLYTQGELIAEMKNKKIGRPSTYATIVSTLLKRKYVIESKKVKRLVPSKLGINVYEFLNNNYFKFVSEDRTRELLEHMDRIEEGSEDYRQVLKQLYDEIQNIG